MELFEERPEAEVTLKEPLAARMRPRTLDEMVGQDHILGPGKILRKAIEVDELHSLILWGPPGSGKTTLAMVIAGATGAHFIAFSAVLSGVKEVRAATAEAKRARRRGERTVLFVDEVHRFNKAQQDAFLPHVEGGDIILIGATTENPSFEVIPALLSRCRVLTLNPLTEEEILGIIERALKDEEHGLGGVSVEFEGDDLRLIANLANGDARAALNILELSVMTKAPGPDGVRRVGEPEIVDAAQKRVLLYDKGGEEHYNLISALHKTLRGSDPDGALYWLARMLEAGEDPRYVLRRMVRFASEDVGMADPQALVVAVAALQAYELIGMPEGNLALAQAAVYLATAPKSNSLYAAYGRVQKDVRDTQALPVPLHLRNAPTRLMKELGYSRGYKYAHDYPGHYVEQEGLPENLRGRRYYQPSDQGYERELRERLARWRGRGKK